MLPPQHSVDAPMRYIDKDDDAWDVERIEKSYDDHPDPEQHPLVQYWAGLSRYDLDAPGPMMADGEVGHVGARWFLREGAEPVAWHLRRLKMRELSQCLDRGGRAGQEMAFRMGVEGVDGLDLKWPKMPLNDRFVEQIHDLVGASIIYRLGQAVILASQPPSAAEGKRSVSARGDV